MDRFRALCLKLRRLRIRCEPKSTCFYGVCGNSQVWQLICFEVVPAIKFGCEFIFRSEVPVTFQLPIGKHKIQNVSLNGNPTANNDEVREFKIGRSFWTILPAKQRFEVIHSNNRAAALRSGNQTYFAEFSKSPENKLIVLLRRENCKQVYRFDLQLAEPVDDTYSHLDSNYV